MTRPAWIACCLIALAPVQAMPADFVPDDQVASDPSSDLPPPEFDRRSKHIVWADRTNKLWVGDVDLVTGQLSPTNGKGILVDTGLSPVGQVQNTPRYTYGAGQGTIVYNKDDNGFVLAKAVEIAPGTWETSLLENGADRWKANGTPEETTDPARIVYNRLAPGGATVVAWRNLDDPATERTVNAVAQGGRFFGSEPAVIIMKTDEQSIVQLYIVPFATGIPEQVTFGPDQKFNPFIWFAPEYQQYLIVAMVDWEQLAIYREINGTWTNIHQFSIPSAKPLLSSPEGFVVNGKSYIAVVTCDQLGGGGFVGQPVGPSEIWVAGIDPEAPFFRRIDDPGYAAQRSEPEPFMLDNGTVTYYTELVAQTHVVKRAATGLAGVTGYDVAHYGGAWSAAFRDNKNCSCTPYAIPDRYTSAYDVPMTDTQFVHPTLGPEDHLYFGTLSTTDTGDRTQLVALDTASGSEAYRIDEETLASHLAATDALVDLNGNYYVPANDALSKYSSGGQPLWRLPTQGLARSAQFTPDGNILFFTWNGWAYVVSPDGALLLARNLTPGRTYPADPSCLASELITSDCAYAGPPAVDAFSNRVYVTQIGTGGSSVLQAFRYQNTPTIDLKKLWSTRVVLAGIATSPVLSADYSRLYLQDGAGNLVAHSAVTGARIWSFPLGFKSDTPPIVSADGYIMPGGSVDRDPAYNFVALVRDRGASARWVLHNGAYAPKSFAAAGASNRFVVAAEKSTNGQLKLLVVDPSGIVSANPWGVGDLPSALKGISLRDDGWVFVQTSGTVGVKAFAPAPLP